MAASNNGFRTKLTDSAASGAITASTPTLTPMNTITYDPLTQNSTSGIIGSITVKVDGYYIACMRTSYLGVVDFTRMLAMIYVARQGGGAVETIRGYDLSSGGIQAAILPACGLLKLLAGDLVAGAINVSTGASTTAAAAVLNTIEVLFVGPL
jgi:hypothetical protein